jgi:2-keto-3-deoxy-L-rhamnonate aldolase RhmA
MRENHVKRALQDGRVQVGTWIHMGAVEVPRILATSGFDYVNIDMEHSAFSIETTSKLCSAAMAAGLTPIVRPSGRDHHLVSRPLDGGAMGVLMPHTDTREEAETAVRASKFPPVGARGSHPPNVHTDFGPMNATEYMARSNEESLVLIQIESEAALRNLDEILSVDGVDGATVGRGDLAADLGVTGGRDDPRIVEAVEAVIAACLRNDKIPGLLVQEAEEAKRWISQGVRLVTFSSEVGILRNAASAALEDIRSVV